ncbi:MAG: protein kinase [Myxococcaceae bacterium]|nr:protein kinase [Myxococcaceae bacterium]
MNSLGPYELVRRLGAGATAEVYLATGPSARGGELVAIKVLLQHLCEDEKAKAAFLTEGRTSLRLQHVNVAEVFEVGEADGRPFLAMEFVRGWAVSTLLKKLKAAGQKLTVDEACEAVRQAALGLHHAHELKGDDGAPLGLVHRDVSPQNLIVSDDGVVKVVDFGLAKATAQQLTVTRGIKGKLRYLPPEQLRGEALDRRADVFALGAVLWELVCGQALYPGQSEAEVFQQAAFNPQPHPDEVAKGLSRALVDVLVKAVDRELSRRTPTALELAQQLKPLSQGAASAQRLGQKVLSFGDPLPRTVAEAKGELGQRRRPSLPGVSSPPPEPAARTQDGTATALSLTSLEPEPVSSPHNERTVLDGAGLVAQVAAELEATRNEPLTMPMVAPVPAPADGPRRPITDPTIPMAPLKRELLVAHPLVSGAKHPAAELPQEATSVSGIAVPEPLPERSRATLGPDASVAMETVADLLDTAFDGEPARKPLRLNPWVVVGAGLVLFLLAVLVGRLIGPGDEAKVTELPIDPVLRLKPKEVAAAPGGGPAAVKPVARGQLVVESKDPGVISEGSVDLGLTGETLSLTAGVHVLNVDTPDGSLHSRIRVTVTSGKLTRVLAGLKPR